MAAAVHCEQKRTEYKMELPTEFNLVTNANGVCFGGAPLSGLAG